MRGSIMPYAERYKEPCRGCPAHQRHGEGLLGQLHGQAVAHRPADHVARVQIEDHGEIESPLRGPYRGDVPGPHPVGLCDRELVIEGVLCHRPPVIRLRGGSPLLHGLGSDPFDTHQPGDAILADAMPLLDQRVPDAGTAVGLTGLLVDHSNRREQGAGVRRLGTLGP